MGTTGPQVSKVVARVASVDLDPASSGLLHDCFKQFGIQLSPVVGDFAESLNRQKFEACIVRLYAPDAEKVLAAARNSTSNRRMVIYGMARNTQEALRFSSYGINAVLDEPLERQGVLRVVRSTHLLVIHELRRYVRIPVVAETVIDVGGSTNIVGLSQEVSAGGMSVRSSSKVPALDTVKVSFALPGLAKINIRAAVCWSRAAEGLYGFRFDTTDQARNQVRNWIEKYLELA